MQRKLLLCKDCVDLLDKLLLADCCDPGPCVLRIIKLTVCERNSGLVSTASHAHAPAQGNVLISITFGTAADIVARLLRIQQQSTGEEADCRRGGGG